MEDNDLNLPFEKLNVSYYRGELKDTQNSTQNDQQKKQSHQSLFEKHRWKMMEKQDSLVLPTEENNNFKYVYSILSLVFFF